MVFKIDQAALLLRGFSAFRNAGYILICLLSIVLLHVIYVWFFSPLCHIPGPFLARFTRLWEFWMIAKGDSHQRWVELHEKYGPVVRIAPNLYSFSEVEDMKAIYSPGNKLPKTTYYNTAGDPERRNIFSMTNADDHALRKRKISNLYTMTSMINYEPAVDKMNAVLMEKFRQFWRENRTVMIPQFVQYYAFDVIGQITVDESFGMMQKEGDAENMLETVKKATLYQNLGGIFPEFHPYFVKVNNLFRVPHAGVVLERVSRRHLEHHKTHPVVNNDKITHAQPFVTKLLKMESEGKVDMLDMIDGIGANIVAGSDTTAITLSAALYYLYRIPNVLSKLRKEIGDLAADGRISDPVTFSEAQNMPYLQAVIMEALRIHPAVGYLLPRRVNKEGLLLAGTYFPEGTEVGVNAWALHHNPRFCGPDYQEFKPERWFNQEYQRNLHLASSFAFGAGSRLCLGKNVSLLELTKVIPQIVRHFDLEFENPNEGWKLLTTWFVWQDYRCWIKPRVEAQA
ncbi:hypothetical protein LTR84_012415 [Exophiala bonariae]|uniref:Cytochrome P450 n=1 Tax=Exophiala bonariae TaxID=1690606 RepID=A0AAV9MR70_9EURO|nr:hypothetical protein LTR84_012415 [Exophiala bonariae]